MSIGNNDKVMPMASILQPDTAAFCLPGIKHELEDMKKTIAITRRRRLIRPRLGNINSNYSGWFEWSGVAACAVACAHCQRNTMLSVLIHVCCRVLLPFSFFPSIYMGSYCESPLLCLSHCVLPLLGCNHQTAIRSSFQF